MTTSETEEMLEKCYEVGCCGSFLLTDTMRQMSSAS